MHQDSQSLEILEELRSEVNLLTYPFFALRNNDVLERDEVEFKKTVRQEGDKLELVWNVSANPKYGYPGPFDKEVHKAIEQIIEESDFPVKNPIQFSIYNLCQRMGINSGGRQYNQIKSALERIQFAAIKSEGAFYHRGRKKWITKTFTLYDGVIFKGEELENGAIAETNYLFLNDLYLESINARYVKPLDFKYYASLKTNIAKRLYELLGVKFFGIFNSNQPYIWYRYSTLCELLPLTRQRYPSDVKRQLEPAHKELKRTNFLKETRWEELEEKEKDWYIYYYPGARAAAEIKRFSSASQVLDQDLPPATTFLSKGEEADIKGWVSELTRLLKDTQNQNRGFYNKLARLVVQSKIPESTVRKCLSEAKTEAHLRNKDPDKEPIKNRSAYFTHLLKHRLKEKGRDLKKLLRAC